MPDTVRILNIDIDNHRFGDFVAGLDEGMVVTPNVDHLMKLQSDREFYDCYLQSEHVVCDSRIIQLVSRLLFPGRGVSDQIAGSDLLPAFFRHHRNNTANMRVFLIGGTEESARRAMESINESTCSDIVVGAYSPPFGFEYDEAETSKIINLVNESGATAIAVGVGAPKQEKWICRHRHRMPGARIQFAVGATIDFAAGEVKRAPRWVTKAGLEWLYRLIQEPGRLMKRYLVDDMPFFWLILKQRFGFYRNPWE